MAGVLAEALCCLGEGLGHLVWVHGLERVELAGEPLAVGAHLAAAVASRVRRERLRLILGLGRARRGQPSRLRLARVRVRAGSSAAAEREARGENRERKQRDGGEAHPPRGEPGAATRPQAGRRS